MYALEGHLSSMARVVTINSVGHTNKEESAVKNIRDNVVGAHYLPTHTIEVSLCSLDSHSQFL